MGFSGIVLLPGQVAVSDRYVTPYPQPLPVCRYFSAQDQSPLLKRS